MTNRLTSGNAALALKVIGVVLILSFLLDFLILLLPFQPTDRGWQINLATALVDRGIVPMVGLGSLLIGYWIDGAMDGGSRGIDLRFPAFILSSLLGLMFLLIFPLHLNNVNQAKAQAINQINQEADQAERQVENQLNQFQTQLNTPQGKAQFEQLQAQARAQFSELLKDETRYKQALESPQLPQQQKDLLKKFKANPQELEKFITQQTDPKALADQRKFQIRQRKADTQKQAGETAWKSGLRIGISSLLLSIGYIIIGWTGLRSGGATQPSTRKAAAR
jgi:hypothetical protein